MHSYTSAKKDSNTTENKVRQVHAFSFYICLLFSPKVTKPRVMWVQSFFSILNEQQIIFYKYEFLPIAFLFLLKLTPLKYPFLLGHSILLFFHSCSFTVVVIEEHYNCVSWDNRSLKVCAILGWFCCNFLKHEVLACKCMLKSLVTEKPLSKTNHTAPCSGAAWRAFCLKI